MPEFEEIFQTKEALGRFTEECGKLLTCNTSIEGIVILPIFYLIFNFSIFDILFVNKSIIIF